MERLDFHEPDLAKDLEAEGQGSAYDDDNDDAAAPARPPVRQVVEGLQLKGVPEPPRGGVGPSPPCPPGARPLWWAPASVEAGAFASSPSHSHSSVDPPSFSIRLVLYDAAVLAAGVLWTRRWGEGGSGGDEPRRRHHG